MSQHQLQSQAAPTAPGKTHATTQQTSDKKGGLPQLNAEDFAPQLVWLALTFGALYWIMSRVALPRIADVIEKRRGRIAADLDAARQFRKKSEIAEAAYKADLAEAKAKAHTIAQDKRDELNARTESKRADVDAKINAKLAESEQRIKSAKGAALKEINKIATSTTGEIVNHLIGDKVSDKDLAAALKSAAVN